MVSYENELMISEQNIFPLLMMVFSQIGEYEETIGTCLVFSEGGKCGSLPKKMHI